MKANNERLVFHIYEPIIGQIRATGTGTGILREGQMIFCKVTTGQKSCPAQFNCEKNLVVYYCGM